MAEKKVQKRTPSASEMDEDLNRLELGIRRLRIQYEMFFGGGLKREPVMLRGNVQKIIKRYNEIPISKVAQRFRFNALVSRYNVFTEMWGRRLRTFEEGDRPSRARIQDSGETVVARCRIQGSDSGERELRKLHAQFLAARRKELKGAAKNVSFERFSKGVAAQTRQLQEKSGCDNVELRLVVEDGDVQLKARPGR